MGIRANTHCFFVDGNSRVLEATTVTDEQRDGSITIKLSPSFEPTVVRAMNVFSTKVAADRAAARNTATSRGGGATFHK